LKAFAFANLEPWQTASLNLFATMRSLLNSISRQNALVGSLVPYSRAHPVSETHAKQHC
jgi:hypothetical protein